MGLSLFGASLGAQELAITGKSSLAACWRNVFGWKTAFIPLIVICITCFACAVGYAEFYSHMLASVFYWTPVPSLLHNPEDFWAVLIAIFPMSVLVCLKDISVMRPATSITLVSCTFTLIAVTIRYFDGSYAPGGFWFHFRQTHINHRFHEQKSFLFEQNAMPMRLFTSQAVLFLCHFNAAKYFSELENPKTDRFTAGLGVAMGLGLVYCSGIMIFVNLTFGFETTALTMDNYSPDDVLINIARIGVSLGVMGCYPLLFCGMREAFIEFLSDTWPKHKDVFEQVVFQNSFSIVMLIISIIIELSSYRLSFLILRVGRTCFGSLLICVIPVVLFIGASYKHMSKASLSRLQVSILLVTVCLGLTVSVMAAIYWLGYGLQ